MKDALPTVITQMNHSACFACFDGTAVSSPGIALPWCCRGLLAVTPPPSPPEISQGFKGCWGGGTDTQPRTRRALAEVWDLMYT